MTIKELYEEAKEKGWEDLQVMVLEPSSADYYGNRTFPKVTKGTLIRRDKTFWPGIDEDFLAII